ncbi:autotransporter outer membrane beta-barrel domain-containing protein, partial [Enterobacteriaceae bacterium H11S18]|uniref:ESPR-type extended signal peptide-containing protein n=1 Tax=Dryocola clanedunensis TaxID=2925396 RepID=UPI0022F03DE8
MNQSYKIVWNESAQDWVVTSELASGKKKTKTTRASQVWQASLILAGVLTAANAQAGDIDVSPFTPTSETIMITGNDNLVQGSGKGFAEWAENDKGFKSISIKDALAKGILTGGTEYANGFNIQQGNRSLATTVKDPVTGNNQTVNVYDNDAFLVTSLADFTFANHYDVGPEGQYVDKFIYEIAPSATLDVGVGETSASWVNTPANFVNIIMKSSSSDPKITSAVYKADDNSTLNYNGKTIVSLGNADNVGSTVPRTIASFQVPVGQTIESKIGTFTVTNVDELKVYNTALIKALQENRLSPADYESEFAKALKHGSISAIDSVSAGDPVTQTINKNQVAYIYASGPSSKVNIADTANIQLFRSDASLIRVENGADLTNAGTIGSFYNVISSGSDVIFAENASVHNTVTGVIDAGTNEEVAGFEYNGHDQSTTYQLGRVAGIEARDSDIVNDGVINVTSPQSYSQQYGIRATNSGNIINNGAINVASNTQVANVLGNNVGNFGVSLAGRDVSMVNNGTISVGRSAQRSLTDTSNDVAVNWAGIKAVSVAVGANFTNKGDIVTGALTHGVTAISVYNTGSVVNQEGTITINSAYAPAGKVPAQSIGIDVNTLVSEVDNSGTITLAGVNGVGLNVHAGAQATNSGTIAVANGIDSASKTANYGIQAEGKDARAILTGNVDLTGDGAIGVYARDGGSVNVDGGSINFLSGTKQLGLLIYGEGSSVASQNSIQDVSTQDSTLYRIDGGATYAANGASLTGSGAGSTILLSTGNGSDIDTKGMTLTASGDGATAVKVEGGAHATIDATTVINLTGNQSVAGSVKGGSTTIYGDAGAAGASVLDSSATLTSAGNVATGAMGYAVATGGTLNHHGTIDITAPGSTGVQINGGTMNNDAVITVDGTAVDIIGAGSVVNNTDTITATDGTAAYRLSNGASLDLTGDGTTNAEGTAHGILLDTGAVGLTVKDATINMAATGTGNGIENRAEIDGIQLTNTTINVGNGAGVRTSASLAQTNSGTINVDGSGTGLLFQNADGSMADNAYDMSKSQGLVINVNSAAGKGMTINTTGAVKSGVSINVKDAAGGSALVVKGNSLSVAQSGTIQSASATQMVDINNGKTSTFTNSGTIASTAAGGLVMDVDQQTVNFTNETGGSLAGAVNLQNGNNTVTLEHGSQAASVFTTGAGDDNYRLTGITADENATLFTTLDGGLGSDTLSLNNSVYTLSDAGKIQNIEHVNLANNSTFTLDKTQLDLSAADAGWNIDDSSTLAMNDDRALSFASHLAGSGLVTVDLGSKDNDFAFTANNAADGFAGTVALANSHFVLDGATTQNNQALSDATLKLGAGSVTDVAKGTQSIGGLAFDGGTIIFDTDTLGRDVSEALIQTAGNLDLSGTGTVQLRTNDVLNAPPVLPDHTLNLLAQDDANPVLQLATSTGTVSGSGANLLLEDKDGNAISQPTQADVLQNGITVANATYDFGLTDGENSDGLYVNYGLKILDLQTKGADALILTAAGETGAATDLSAQLTGSGDLAIDTGKDNTVSLSAIRNDYTGVTDVRSGTLRTDSDTVLGNTRELHQAAGTRVDLNGHAQTVGLLNTDATATTDFNGGSLAVTHGGIVNGMLTGAGELAVNGGTLTVNGANAAMTA